jgi:hypothetical protein
MVVRKRVTATRRNVAGIEVDSGFPVVFCKLNRASSSFWRSAARPFASAAASAFTVGPSYKVPGHQWYSSGHLLPPALQYESLDPPQLASLFDAYGLCSSHALS